MFQGENWSRSFFFEQHFSGATVVLTGTADVVLADVNNNKPTDEAAKAINSKADFLMVMISSFWWNEAKMKKLQRSTSFC